jgi:hypothetical protein
MLELMNIELLEVNARRRVEVIAQEMRDARRENRQTAVRDDARVARVAQAVRAEADPACHTGRVAGRREPLTEG